MISDFPVGHRSRIPPLGSFGSIWVLLLGLALCSVGCAVAPAKKSPTLNSSTAEEHSFQFSKVELILSPQDSGRQIPLLSEAVSYLQSGKQSVDGVWKLVVRRRVKGAIEVVCEGLVTEDTLDEVLDEWFQLEVGDFVALHWNE